MKVGAEDRKKLIAAILLMVGAAVALYTLVVQPAAAPPSASAAAPASRTIARRAAAARPRTGGAPSAEPENLDPTLHLALLHTTENVTYEGTGRDIFRPQNEEPIPHAITTPLKDKGKPTPTPTPTPTGPPPPPPIPLKFYGFANKPGEPGKKIFLSEGDNIFVASEGDIVNRRYRVVKIGQTSVEIEDLLNNNRQTIPLT